MPKYYSLQSNTEVDAIQFDGSVDQIKAWAASINILFDYSFLVLGADLLAFDSNDEMIRIELGDYIVVPTNLAVCVPIAIHKRTLFNQKFKQISHKEAVEA
jgi:hypothetical protein